MNLRVAAVSLLLIGVLSTFPTIAAAGPAQTPTGFYYPLDGITSQGGMAGKVLPGGYWLSGLGNEDYVQGRIHAGVDLKPLSWPNTGDAVYAIGPGVVDPQTGTGPNAGLHGGFGPGWTDGYALVIRHPLAGGGEVFALYGHLQNLLVGAGDRVDGGTHIADIGPWLGKDGGPHLHLSIRYGSYPRKGWGTPTKRGYDVADGAEVAGTEAEVAALGYRNPVAFLHTQSPEGATTQKPASSKAPKMKVATPQPEGTPTPPSGSGGGGGASGLKALLKAGLEAVAQKLLGSSVRMGGGTGGGVAVQSAPAGRTRFVGQRRFNSGESRQVDVVMDLDVHAGTGQIQVRVDRASYSCPVQLDRNRHWVVNEPKWPGLATSPTANGKGEFYLCGVSTTWLPPFGKGANQSGRVDVELSLCQRIDNPTWVDSVKHAFGGWYCRLQLDPVR